MKTQDGEIDRDPYLCHCGGCSDFWKQNKSKRDSTLLGRPQLERCSNTTQLYKATLLQEKHPAVLKIGDRVLVKGRFPGVVRYIGPLHDEKLSPCTYVGVKLDDQVGSTHNGTVQGKRYFYCPSGHDAMVKYSAVTRIKPAVKRPPVYGNSMFPSFKQICQARKQRAQLDPCMNFGPPFNSRNEDGERVVSSRPASHSNQRPYSAPIPPHVVNNSDTHSISSHDVIQLGLSKPNHLQQYAQWRKNFGGDQRAEILAKTLQKLRLAYEKGKTYHDEGISFETSSQDHDNDDEDDEDNDYDSSDSDSSETDRLQLRKKNKRLASFV